MPTTNRVLICANNQQGMICANNQQGADPCQQPKVPFCVILHIVHIEEVYLCDSRRSTGPLIRVIKTDNTNKCHKHTSVRSFSISKNKFYQETKQSSTERKRITSTAIQADYHMKFLFTEVIGCLSNDWERGRLLEAETPSQKDCIHRNSQ